MHTHREGGGNYHIIYSWERSIAEEKNQWKFCKTIKTNYFCPFPSKTEPKTKNLTHKNLSIIIKKKKRGQVHPWALTHKRQLGVKDNSSSGLGCSF